MASDPPHFAVPRIPRQSLHIAHVVLNLNAGGLERVVLDLARAGRSLGQRVTIVCIEQPGTLAAQAEALGLAVLAVGKQPGLRPSAVGRLKALLRDLRPDVVHTHQVGALLYAGPASRATRVPLVVHTEHGKHYARRWRMRILGRFASRYARRFFCVSADLAREVLGCRVVNERKTCVVHNGIDFGRFASGAAGGLRRRLGIHEEAPIIGTIGRLAEIKCQDVLLRAFAVVRRSVPRAHLLLVGDGEMRPRLTALAGELGITDVTHFAGYQSEPERYLGGMDVFALTSRSEGMPLVVLEAMAAEVPVVASSVGGLPEMIDHGRTGWLFRPGDVAELAEVLTVVLRDAEAARRVVSAAAQSAKARFSLERMAEAYEAHYRELLRVPSAGSLSKIHPAPTVAPESARS